MDVHPVFLHVSLTRSSYLEFLPSDGLHIALLADGELVGDLGVRGVDLGPGEVVSVLGDLCDQLVVATLLDDFVGDACSGKARGVLARRDPT